jgi:valyl-tRNA synthetase
MNYLIEVVTAIRNIRAAWNIEQQREISAIVNISDKKRADFVKRNADFIKRLAKVGSLEAGKAKKPKNSATSVVSAAEIYVPLEGVVDFEKEKTRLKKDEERVSSEISAITARLKDKNFTSKAPQDVVVKQRLRKDELATQLKKLKANLKDIEA